MPDVAKPVSKVDMDPVFQRQLERVQQLCQEQEQQLRTGGQIRWMRPTGWNGNPFDHTGMATPFDRSKSNNDAVRAIESPNTPGVVQDIINACTMVDYLAVMERSFRARMTMNRSRRFAHLAGTRHGQGSSLGVFKECGIEFVSRSIKRAKGPQ